ncbi:hypothetical protein EBU71_20500 [bacterium]|nr:hypothetical protein [Candidatus Elulimicrobium humile]
MFIIAKDELFQVVVRLIQYAKRELFKDEQIGQTQIFVQGFRDILGNGLIITRDAKFVKFVQTYMWYWFEQKIRGFSYPIRPGRRMFSFRISTIN